MAPRTLLGSKFELMADANCRAYLNWDARIELLTPTDADLVRARKVREQLSEKGRVRLRSSCALLIWGPPWTAPVLRDLKSLPSRRQQTVRPAAR